VTCLGRLDFDKIKEDLDKVLLELQENNRTVPILVEGIKDVKALRSLGFTGTIIKLNLGLSIFNLCAELSRTYKEMIILTDWDHKGGRLCRLLTEGCDANDMKYDLNFRKRLAHICKKEIKDVQGIPKFLKNLEEKIAMNVK
jgi:5S rRNA maturation endonuclease (ribonuclease M5)